MNLLKKYVPGFSGHIESIHYDENARTLDIVFYDRPEEFNPVLRLSFEGVTGFSEDIYDLDSDSIELVIALDQLSSGCCLHTDQREITFKFSKVSAFENNI